MVARLAKKFKLGSLTEDDMDQDYAPGRSEETMSAAHKSSLAQLVERTRKAADQIKTDAVKKSDDQIVIVLEPE